MPKVQIKVDAVLFDMDGTLIDSTPAVNETWAIFAREYNLNLEQVLATAHGWRTIENLRRFCPSISEEKLPSEVERFEKTILDVAEETVRKGGSGGIVAMPGARELIAQITAGAAENPERRPGWAIVTSATNAYAQKGFAAARVSAAPKTFVTSDVCTRGKPDPQPYVLGAEKSGLPNAHGCLVVEDAPPGVRSGKAAGARTLGLRTTHSGEKQWAAGADYVVEDLSKVSARWEGQDLIIEIEAEERPTTEGGEKGIGGSEPEAAQKVERKVQGN